MVGKCTHLKMHFVSNENVKYGNETPTPIEEGNLLLTVHNDIAICHYFI